MNVYIRFIIATPMLRVPTRLGPTTARVTLGFQVTADPAVCYNCYSYDNMPNRASTECFCSGNFSCAP